MPAAETRKTLAVQHIDATGRVGDDIVLVTAPLEQRHLEVAFEQLDRPSGHHANRFAAHFEDIMNLDPPAVPGGLEAHRQACPARRFEPVSAVALSPPPAKIRAAMAS
ncbi:MAG: hypothetical protein WB662_12115, partial [Methyloceanibacter sp.]